MDTQYKDPTKGEGIDKGLNMQDTESKRNPNLVYTTEGNLLTDTEGNPFQSYEPRTLGEIDDIVTEKDKFLKDISGTNTAVGGYIDPEFGKSSYDTQARTMTDLMDINEVRAREQGTVAKLAGGFGRYVATTGLGTLGNVVGTVVGLGEGIQNAVEGEGGNAWTRFWDGYINNSVNEFVHDSLDKVNEWMPNYRSQYEKDMGVFRSIFTAGFLSDQVANLGWTSSAILSTVLTGGMGGASAASGLAKVLGASKGAQSFIYRLIGGITGAMAESATESIDRYHEAKDAYSGSLRQEEQALKRQIQMEVAQRYEQDGYNPNLNKNIDYENAVFQEITNKYSDAYNQLQVKENNIESKAKAAARQTFLLNEVILSATNTIGVFSNIKAPMMNAERLAKGSITNIFRRDGAKVAASKGELWAREGLEMLSQGAEEIEQKWAGETAQAYYGQEYNPKYIGQVRDWMTVAGDKFFETVEDRESWKEFAAGFITGATGAGGAKRTQVKGEDGKMHSKIGFDWVGGIWSMANDVNKTNEVSEGIYNQVNQVYNDKNLQRKLRLITGSLADKDAMLEAAQTGDKKAYMDNANNLMVRTIEAFADLGKLGDLRALVGQNDNISDEELEKFVMANVEEETDENGKPTGRFKSDLGLVDSNGEPLSRTEEGKKELRKRFKEQTSKVLDTIDFYGKAIEKVDSNTGYKLDRAQLARIAWGMTQAELANARINSTTEKISNAIKGYNIDYSKNNRDKAVSMLNNLTESLNEEIKRTTSLPDSEEKTKRLSELQDNLKSINDEIEQIKSLEKGDAVDLIKNFLDKPLLLAHMLNNKSSSSEDGKTTYLADAVLERLDDAGLLTEDLKRDINDVIKLYRARHNYDSMVNELTENPQELTELMDREADIITDSNTKELAKNLNSELEKAGIKDLNDFKQKAPEIFKKVGITDDNFRDVFNKAAESNPTLHLYNNAILYQKKVANNIENSNVDGIVKQTALTLLNGSDLLSEQFKYMSKKDILRALVKDFDNLSEEELATLEKVASLIYVAKEEINADDSNKSDTTAAENEAAQEEAKDVEEEKSDNASDTPTPETPVNNPTNDNLLKKTLKAIYNKFYGTATFTDENLLSTYDNLVHEVGNAQLDLATGSDKEQEAAFESLISAYQSAVILAEGQPKYAKDYTDLANTIKKTLASYYANKGLVPVFPYDVVSTVDSEIKELYPDAKIIFNTEEEYPEGSSVVTEITMSNGKVTIEVTRGPNTRNVQSNTQTESSDNQQIDNVKPEQLEGDDFVPVDNDTQGETLENALLEEQPTTNETVEEESPSETPAEETQQFNDPLAQDIHNGFNNLASSAKEAFAERQQKMLDEQGYIEFSGETKSSNDAIDMFKSEHPDFREEILPDGKHRFYPNTATEEQSTTETKQDVGKLNEEDSNIIKPIIERALNSLQKWLDSNPETKGSKQIKNAKSELENLIQDKNIDILGVLTVVQKIVLNASKGTERGGDFKKVQDAAKRIIDNTLVLGYELVDMLNKPYHEGMKLDDANFINDESLVEGEQKITGITKPQINYNGKMIQSAKITVSQNLVDDEAAQQTEVTETSVTQPSQTSADENKTTTTETVNEGAPSEAKENTTKPENTPNPKRPSELGKRQNGVFFSDASRYKINNSNQFEENKVKPDLQQILDNEKVFEFVNYGGLSEFLKDNPNAPVYIKMIPEGRKDSQKVIGLYVKIGDRYQCIGYKVRALSPTVRPDFAITNNIFDAITGTNPSYTNAFVKLPNGTIKETNIKCSATQNEDGYFTLTNEDGNYFTVNTIGGGKIPYKAYDRHSAADTKVGDKSLQQAYEDGNVYIGKIYNKNKEIELQGKNGSIKMIPTVDLKGGICIAFKSPTGEWTTSGIVGRKLKSEDINRASENSIIASISELLQDVVDSLNKGDYENAAGLLRTKDLNKYLKVYNYVSTNTKDGIVFTSPQTVNGKKSIKLGKNSTLDDLVDALIQCEVTYAQPDNINEVFNEFLELAETGVLNFEQQGKILFGFETEKLDEHNINVEGAAKTSGKLLKLGNSDVNVVIENNKITIKAIGGGVIYNYKQVASLLGLQYTPQQVNLLQPAIDTILYNALNNFKDCETFEINVDGEDVTFAYFEFGEGYKVVVNTETNQVVNLNKNRVLSDAIEQLLYEKELAKSSETTNTETAEQASSAQENEEVREEVKETKELPHNLEEALTELRNNIGEHTVLINDKKIVRINDRPVTVIKIGDFNLPFYCSTGKGGKEAYGIPARKWYPIFGIDTSRGKAGFLNKGNENEIKSFYGSDILRQICDILNDVYGDVVDYAETAMPTVTDIDTINITVNQNLNPVPNKVKGAAQTVRNNAAKEVAHLDSYFNITDVDLTQEEESQVKLPDEDGMPTQVDLQPNNTQTAGSVNTTDDNKENVILREKRKEENTNVYRKGRGVRVSPSPASTDNVDIAELFAEQQAEEESSLTQAMEEARLRAGFDVAKFFNNGTTTVKDVLTKIANENNSFSNLANNLLNQLKDFGVQIVLSEYSDEAMGNPIVSAGIYDPISNKIYIKPSQIKGKLGTNQLLLHEILHAIVFNTKKDTNKLKALTKTFWQVRKSILKQYGVKNIEEIKSPKVKRDLYGLTNVDEFISELFVNGRFAKIVDRAEPTFLDRLLDWLFGNITKLSSIAKKQIKELLTDFSGNTISDRVSATNDYISNEVLRELRKENKSVSNTRFISSVINKVSSEGKMDDFISKVQTINSRETRDNLADFIRYTVSSYYDELNNQTKAEMDVIIANAPRNKDGKLLAPNGKPSNLSPKQWALVRTKAFKEWFGDWENNPEMASKVVDENGEPLVVYHGSNEMFNTFNISKKRYNVHDKGIFFTTTEDRAKRYGNNIIAAFINLRNPSISNFNGNLTFEELRKQENAIINNSDDGSVLNTIDKEGVGVQYVVFNPNQIKSATDNVGTFSRENDNILDNVDTLTDSQIVEMFYDNEFGLNNNSSMKGIREMLDLFKDPDFVLTMQKGANISNFDSIENVSKFATSIDNKNNKCN